MLLVPLGRIKRNQWRARKFSRKCFAPRSIGWSWSKNESLKEKKNSVPLIYKTSLTPELNTLDYWNADGVVVAFIYNGCDQRVLQMNHICTVEDITVPCSHTDWCKSSFDFFTQANTHLHTSLSTLHNISNKTSIRFCWINIENILYHTQTETYCVKYWYK